MSLKIIFMGTPDFAVPTLAEICARGHNVVAVYAQPPRPAGRGMADRLTPVHKFAQDADIDVFTPKTFKDPDEQKRFQALGCDVAVIVAYGLILPRAVLEAPRLGCYNLHASLLPRWRGAAPIQRAIMAGDRETGVMVMRMEKGLDTGPVCMTSRTDIPPDMTASELHDVLAGNGGKLMMQALDNLEQGTLQCEPQTETGVSYAKKIEKSETRIEWQHPAQDIHNHIRGLSPFPGAWCEMQRDGEPQRVKILKSELVSASGQVGKAGEVMDDIMTIACGTGSVRITCLQRAGKNSMNMTDFLRGWSVAAGDRLE